LSGAFQRVNTPFTRLNGDLGRAKPAYTRLFGAFVS
jgi:hypothetical protein